MEGGGNISNVDLAAASNPSNFMFIVAVVASGSYMMQLYILWSVVTTSIYQGVLLIIFLMNMCSIVH